ncbi:PA3496 family putative envelope integrity protein [Pseudomonas sp. 5P_3.1_Bac2]|uniref:PA3496 family putative envelope integrity protein n=1 Tax=Pseudomonas sp. 5P_3.1_Bac2 TaxID=2971617 RepID=UPI0021C86A29|nr:transcriptional regulator [Pseudomonas sp. 5P_3.1_Bac2]MCU1719203.1 transcriptional regulator [Pseudomonas sp. 5P_3.1_Bac2]
MSVSSENTQAFIPSAKQNRRKVIDQRRMEYRRAIETYAEQRRLQEHLWDFPELIGGKISAGSSRLEGLAN